MCHLSTHQLMFCSIIQHPTQLMMLEKLPTLTKTMQFSKLKEFLEGDFIRPFVQLQMGDSHDIKLAMELRLGAMRGLEAALRVPDPPQMIKMLLHQTVQTVYDMMPKELDVSINVMLSCVIWHSHCNKLNILFD